MAENAFWRAVRSVGSAFHPPFYGLALFFTLYYFFAFAVYPHNPMWRGDLPDTDDYMYLTQVLDWLHGQGWYDNIQHRLDPPSGVPIHFSRFTMLPMAGLIKVFEFLGLGPKGSAQLMALFYPVFLLWVWFQSLRWTAQSLMPKEWAGVTAFVGFFATHTIYMFQPGHVDHHGLVAILVAASLGCAVRMMQAPERRRWPLLAGLALALGLTVALEILPWLVLMAAFLGIWSAVKGANAARSGVLFALTLFVASAAFLALTRPLADIMNPDVLTYSAVYVAMMAGVAVSFAGVFLVSRWGIGARMVAGAVLAVASGSMFLERFPEMISGPYGGIDPALATIILGEIIEAQPLKLPATNWMDMFWVAGSAFLALPLACYYTVSERAAQRWIWALLLLLLSVAFMLTMFYQRRYAGTMNMFVVFPLALFFQRGWAWIGQRWRGRQRFFAELGLIALVGPLLTLLWPALYDGRSLSLGVFLFPVNLSQEAVACQSYELENVLRNPLGLGSHPRLIMNTLGEGPELLFRTPHSILAAPYHMNVAGNLDSMRFFSTPYPDEAEAIARRRHIDLVVTCAYASNFYFHIAPWKKDGAEEGPGKDFAPHFIERLLIGHIPAWLKPVKVEGLNNFVVYEVLPPKQ